MCDFFVRVPEFDYGGSGDLGMDPPDLLNTDISC